MREALHQTAIGVYLLWLVLVVLLLFGRYTAFPRSETVHSGVVVGAAVLTVVGAGNFLRIGYKRLID